MMLLAPYFKEIQLLNRKFTGRHRDIKKLNIIVEKGKTRMKYIALPTT